MILLLSGFLIGIFIGIFIDTQIKDFYKEQWELAEQKYIKEIYK